MEVTSSTREIEPLQSAVEDPTAALSDEDVELLHEIIQQAEQSYGPRFGPGLFAAYDELIERHKIPRSREQKCFLFLIRMLSWRGEDDTLFSRFQHVLATMGILVDRGDEQFERAEVCES